MSAKTGIEWTDATWNPVTGCAKVSQGCRNCYALRDWPRMAAAQHTVYYGREFTDVQCHRERLEQPIRWRRPRMIFVNSMSDLFHESVPDEFIDSVFAVMAIAEQHTFQVLTKRPERMQRYMSTLQARSQEIAQAAMNVLNGKYWSDGDGMWDCVAHRIDAGPLPNVWLGVSVEDQATADERIPHLLQTSAAVRWISAEPLLGPVDLSGEYLAKKLGGRYPFPSLADEHRTKLIDLLDWVVVGGESGRKARPMHPAWARMLRDQCKAAGVQFLFKQWGEWKPISEMADEECDALYRSNRVAKEGEDQRVLDDIYGRTCRVETTAIGYGGECGFDVAYRNNGMQMFQVGKKAAGRLLDGAGHDCYPS